MGYLGKGIPGYRWLDYALDHYLTQLLEGALGTSPWTSSSLAPDMPA